MNTEIICVLDRSGSMATVVDDSIGGFNTFLAEQKKLGDAKLSVVLFDHEYTPLYQGIDLKDAQELNHDTFVPRGSTALLDAIGKTISDAGKRFSNADVKPEKVIFVILTDGEENSSVEFSKSKIKEMIAHQTEKYSWEFIYLGANQDAIQAGGSIGIAAAACENYASDSDGTREAYSKMSLKVAKSRMK